VSLYNELLGGELRSWQHSTTDDMLWAARKTVLDTIAQMEGIEDVLDPLGCEREGVDRDGNPLHDDSSMYTVEHVEVWRCRLLRVNSMLRELGQRMARGEGDGGRDVAGEAPGAGAGGA
jgi:hypothetical protein